MMIITTEEAERLAQTHDLVRFTLGMKAHEHDLTAAMIRSLAAERDALRAENAKLAASNHAYLSDYQESADEIEKLRAALREAIEMIEFWAAYASPFFQEKHDLAWNLQKLRAALGEGEKE